MYPRIVAISLMIFKSNMFRIVAPICIGLLLTIDHGQMWLCRIAMGLYFLLGFTVSMIVQGEVDKENRANGKSIPHHPIIRPVVILTCFVSSLLMFLSFRAGIGLFCTALSLLVVSIYLFHPKKAVIHSGGRFQYLKLTMAGVCTLVFGIWLLVDGIQYVLSQYHI